MWSLIFAGRLVVAINKKEEAKRWSRSQTVNGEIRMLLELD